MILFRELRYKNFLLSGNQFTTIYLDKSPTTLITGKNGVGKSTIIDALTFVLYGKAYRNINKPQLINSINEKELLVEAEFSVGKNSYLVRRGMKPNIFEIFINGKLLDQDSRTKDYQKQLEQQILKMSEKSFRQIVVLGSADYIPFMKLVAADRRKVIEDLLDISIFSTMNVVLKEQMDHTRDQLRDFDSKIMVAEEKVSIQSGFVENTKQKIIQQIETNYKNIFKHQLLVNDYKRKSDDIIANLTSKKNSIKDTKKVENTRTEILTYFNQANANLQRLEDQVEFFHNEDECPTCKQLMTSDHKEAMVQEKHRRIEEVKSGLVAMEMKVKKCEERLAEIASIRGEIEVLEAELTDASVASMAVKQYIKKLEAEQIELEVSKRAADMETTIQLKEYQKELDGLRKDRTLVTENRSYLETIGIMLKDTGIKTKIIKRYLPIMNTTINKYLTTLGLAVNFNLDESFSETIKSRFRDTFTYSSFSEGEKARIDLAIMLTWRQIASMKNSANTNLLIFDEVFDSSLDTDATDELLNLLNELADNGGINIFVISHKSGDILFDKFRSAIQFDRIGGFSRIVNGA